VAILRFEAGRDPYDRRLPDLVGELSTQSETFRSRWAAHNVCLHDTGVKHLHHPVVADLSLTYERMELLADPGLTMYAYTAEPGSKSEEALNLLASWTATLDEVELANVPDNAWSNEAIRSATCRSRGTASRPRRGPASGSPARCTSTQLRRRQMRHA
jgi:hypothetical protein